MKISSQLGKLKYKCARTLEGHPLLSNIIYNNISRFKFLFPHEKDYHGIKFFCPDQKTRDFVDIGANIGLSTIGFRKLGYENRVLMFEANPFLAGFLEKLQKKYSGLEIRQIALGNQNEEKEIYLAYYKDRCLHTFSSFDKAFISESLAKSFPGRHKDIEIRASRISMRRFDDLNMKVDPEFIKIDVEGFEHEIIKGMKETIKKFRPVFLIEYNAANFKDVFDLLGSDYTLHSYNFQNDRVNRVEADELPSLTQPDDPFAIRNLFFVPA